MNNHKYFKATLIDHSDEEAIYNTFSCYLCVLAILVTVILDQWTWNYITMIAMIGVCCILYRIGYRLGTNIATK